MHRSLTVQAKKWWAFLAVSGAKILLGSMAEVGRV